jgi:hypothetical protein
MLRVPTSQAPPVLCPRWVCPMRLSVGVEVMSTLGKAEWHAQTETVRCSNASTSWKPLALGPRP